VPAKFGRTHEKIKEKNTKIFGCRLICCPALLPRSLASIGSARVRRSSAIGCKIAHWLVRRAAF
jgi:hypothetical protein